MNPDRFKPSESPAPCGVEAAIEGAVETLRGLHALTSRIEAACRLLADTLLAGGRVLTAGNGGSAAEAMHMAEELTGRFRADRRSLPGLSLCADGTTLTCIANDFGFDAVFARQVEGLGRAGDLLVLFSTSGRAPNLLRAIEAAKRNQLSVLTLLGRDGGALAGCGDVELIVDTQVTERIQEAHLLLVHLLLDHVERCFPAAPEAGN